MRLGLYAALSAIAVSSCECDTLLGRLPEPKAVLAHGDDEAPPLPTLEIALGAVEVGTGTNVVFDVRNDGNKRLHVADVKMVTGDERCPLPSGAFTIEAPVLQGDPAFRSFALDAGAAQQVTIRFAPTSGQPLCTVVEVQSDDPTNPRLRALITGQGDAAALCADRAVVDFGEVYLGDTKEESFTLTSCGTRPIAIAEVARNDQFPPFDVDPVSVPTTLPVGDAITVQARFTPTQEGSHTIANGTSGALTFTTDANGQSYRVDLVASARRPPSCEIQVLPSALHFGSVAQGRTSMQNVLVRNIGELDCTLTSIDVRAPAGSFSRVLVDAAPGDVLGPQQSAMVEVTFAPTTVAGVENGFLDVVTTDPVSPTITVPLEGNSVELQPCMLEAAPTALNFGAQTINRTAERTLQLLNIGTEACTVSGMTITSGSPEFTVINTTFPVIGSPLMEGSTMNVVVAFRPTTPGARIGNLRVNYKEMGFSFPAPPTQTLDVPLSGDAAAPCIAVVPQDVDFGAVATGATADEEVSIRNCGAADLSLRGLQMRVGSHPDFVVQAAPSLPLMLPPGDTTTVTVRARPTTAGVAQAGAAMHGALEVLSDLPPEAVALRANAPACTTGLQCAPTTVQFGDVDVGTDMVRSFTCQNPGTTPVSIAPTVAAPFSVVSAPTTIQPGDSAIVLVRYAPTAGGGHAQTLDVGANACDGVEIQVAVRGQGTDELPACPAPQAFTPQVEWTWDGAGSPVPSSDQIWVTPLVGRTQDTNADGFVTRDDVPTVVFATFDKADFPGMAASAGGEQDTISDPIPALLRAVRGDTGAHLWTVQDEDHRVNSSVTPAIVDLDGDGKVEIVAQKWILLEGVEVFPDGPKLLGKFIRGNLIAFNSDGSFRWISDEWTRSQNEMEDSAGPAVGDVDGDGFPEIAIGDHLFDKDGRLRWRGGKGTGSAGHGPGSVLVDVDGEPGLELVAGPTVYKADGTVLWDKMSALEGDGLSAVADMDQDGDNEVVFRGYGAAPGANGSTFLASALWILDGRTGAVVHGPVFPPAEVSDGASCRQPDDTDEGNDDKCTPIASHKAIMDVDADGDLDVVLANRSAIVAYDAQLDEVWRAMMSDQSGASGPVGFDFENDGYVNAVYNDESTVYAFDWQGNAIYEAGYISRTITETVAIADVDNDGHANLVIGSNEPELGMSTGLQMLSNTGTSWAQARGIWNQHAYVEQLVGELGTAIPYSGALPGFRVATPRCE